MHHDLELGILREIKALLDCSSDEYLHEMRMKKIKPTKKVFPSTGLLNSTYLPDVNCGAKELKMALPNCSNDTQSAAAVVDKTKVKVSKKMSAVGKGKTMPIMTKVEVMNVDSFDDDSDYDVPNDDVGETIEVFPDTIYMNTGASCSYLCSE